MSIVGHASKADTGQRRKEFVLYLCCTVVLVISCTSQRVSSDHVWAIVKVSYDPAMLKAVGGSCGTVFFVSETTFITVHHGSEANTEMLRPNAGYPNVRVFLANSKGETIEDFWIVKRVPEYDLAIGRISKPHPAVRVCPLQTEIAAGDRVYNIGFPNDEGIREYSFLINGDKLIVQRIDMRPITQDGSVKAITKATVRAVDVNLQDKTVAVLDYSSRVGFSGGPLVSRNSGKVVGLMSFVVPQKDDPNTPVVALRMADLKSIIETEGQKDSGEKE
jgi:hypothetical protein